MKLLSFRSLLHKNLLHYYSSLLHLLAIYQAKMVLVHGFFYPTRISCTKNSKDGNKSFLSSFCDCLRHFWITHLNLGQQNTYRKWILIWLLLCNKSDSFSSINVIFNQVSLNDSKSISISKFLDQLFQYQYNELFSYTILYIRITKCFYLDKINILLLIFDNYSLGKRLKKISSVVSFTCNLI